MRFSTLRARSSSLIRLAGATLLVGGSAALLMNLGFASGGTSGVVVKVAPTTPAPARVIGFIAAGVPQGATKRAVFVPNVQVTLRTAGGTTLRSTLSDLSGRFQFTPVANGSYLVCWHRAGFVDGCGDRFTMTGYDQLLKMRPIRPDPAKATFFGRVQLADGSNPRTWEPLDGVDAFATVTATVPGKQGPVASTPVNDYGEYVLAGVPAGTAVTVRAAIEKTKLGVAGGKRSKSSFRKLDLTLPNRPPEIAGLVPRTGSGGNRARFSVAPNTDVLSVTAYTDDPNGDQVRILWTLPNNQTTSSKLQNSTISYSLKDNPVPPGGTLEFHAMASDGKGGYATQTITVYTGGTRFSGIVRRADRTPIDGAQVEIGGQTATTTKDGRFELVVKDDDRFVVNISKEGFMPVSAVYDRGVTGGLWTLTPATRRKFGLEDEIVLVDARNPGARVAIQPNSLVDEANPRRAPTGPVTVSIATVDPSARDQLPGDNTGVEGGKDVGLIEYGGVFVEVTDATGRKLNLRDGATANVTVPVPQGIVQAGKPLDLLTYSTNSTPRKGQRGNPNGIWTREGSAQKVGSAYVATVSHFSFISLGVTLTNPACIRLDAVGMPASFDLEVTTHDPGTGTPVVQKKAFDNSQLRFHLITGLPPNDTNVTLRALKPGTATAIKLLLPNPTNAQPPPTGTVLKAESGGPSSDVFPFFPYTSCGGFSGVKPKPGDLASAVLVDAAVPLQVVTEFLYLNAKPGFSKNLTNGPAERSKWIKQAFRYYEAVDPLDLRKDVIGFRARNHFGNGETIAAYANSADLGFGREMHCQRHKVTGLSGFDVACYVTNYGNKDSDDFDDFLQALAGSKDDPKTGPHAGAIATVGMEYSRIEDPSDPTGNKFVSDQRVVKFYVWAGAPTALGKRRVAAADLDGFGLRPVPQLCAVCHGGVYAGPTQKDGTAVWSASSANLHSNFIAFDLLGLTTPKVVESGGTVTDHKANQQREFKRLNKDMVLASLPGRAIRSLIERMYPGTEVTQNENIEAPGWKKKTGSPSDRDVYRDVIAPSCRTCHYSQDASDKGSPTLTILDWDQSKELAIYSPFAALDVCDKQVMPHALITHRRFWLSDNPKQKRILRAFLADHDPGDPKLKNCR